MSRNVWRWISVTVLVASLAANGWLWKERQQRSVAARQSAAEFEWYAIGELNQLVKAGDANWDDPVFRRNFAEEMTRANIYTDASSRTAALVSGGQWRVANGLHGLLFAWGVLPSRAQMLADSPDRVSAEDKQKLHAFVDHLKTAGFPRTLPRPDDDAAWSQVADAVDRLVQLESK